MRIFCIVIFSVFCFLFPVSAFADALPPELADGGVLFQYEDLLAQEVSVAGTFNDWDPKKNPLEKTKDGLFQLVMPLEQGEYVYKYVIDGTWMSGEDLKLNIIRQDGRLHIYPRQPFLRFPFNSRIKFDGYYLMKAVLSNDVDGPGGKIRTSAPRNDIDLNFGIKVIDPIYSWIQLNVNTINNDDKVNLDEGFLEFTTPHFVFKPFETHWHVDFDNPLHSTEEYIKHFDDEIYMIDEERPFYHKFGRYARGMSIDYNIIGLEGTLLFADLNKLDQNPLNEDLWGIRMRKPGRRLKLGLTFLQSQRARSFKADENGDGNTNELTTEDLEGKTIEFPDKSGQFFQTDYVRQIHPGGKNSKTIIGIDAELDLGGWDVFAEVQARKQRAAAIAIDNGVGVAFGYAYGNGISDSTVVFERVFGEESTGFEIYMGLLNRGKTWSNQISFTYNDFSAFTFTFDDVISGTSLADSTIRKVTPEWLEFTHKLHLNRRPDQKWGFDIETRLVSRTNLKSDSYTGNIYYTEEIDPVDYFSVIVPWVKRTVNQRWKLYYQIHNLIRGNLTYNWMKIRRFNELGRGNISTSEFKPKVEWKFTEKWELDIGARFKTLKYVAASGFADTGIEGSFFKPFVGLKYNWSKLVDIRMWYGLDPYDDEDKRLGDPWRRQEIFNDVGHDVINHGKNTGFGKTLMHTLVDLEQRIENEARFAIQIDMRF